MGPQKDLHYYMLKTKKNLTFTAQFLPLLIFDWPRDLYDVNLGGEGHDLSTGQGT